MKYKHCTKKFEIDIPIELPKGAIILTTSYKYIYNNRYCDENTCNFVIVSFLKPYKGE